MRSGTDPRDYTLENILKRMGQKDDPWQGMMQHRQSLTAHEDTLDRLLSNEAPADEEK